MVLNGVINNNFTDKRQETMEFMYVFNLQNDIWYRGGHSMEANCCYHYQSCIFLQYVRKEQSDEKITNVKGC